MKPFNVAAVCGLFVFVTTLLPPIGAGRASAATLDVCRTPLQECSA